VSGEYCTIPNGTEAPGKLLISPTVPVPLSVSTWSDNRVYPRQEPPAAEGSCTYPVAWPVSPRN
jgi:hypothetical protein